MRPPVFRVLITSIAVDSIVSRHVAPASYDNAKHTFSGDIDKTEEHDLELFSDLLVRVSFKSAGDTVTSVVDYDIHTSLDIDMSLQESRDLQTERTYEKLYGFLECSIDGSFISHIKTNTEIV